MFDINTAIGHWPFRQIPNSTAGELRDVLQRHGIGGAATAHTHALFYKNCHDANLELAEAIEPQRDFFVGVATLNPTYAAWERDLAACVDDLQLKALRLVPQYHDYVLSSAEAKALAAAAAAAGLPIFIPHRVVDIRQRHWLDTERINTLTEVFTLAEAVPDATFVLTECRESVGSMSASSQARACAHVCLETSRLPSVYEQTLARLVHALGPDRLLFGSGAPFKEITPARLKWQHADLSADEKQRVGGDNARALLSLKPDPRQKIR